MLFKTNSQHTNQEGVQEGVQESVHETEQGESFVNKLRKVLHFSSKARLNIVMQAEASECGLAGVAMIANNHVKNISLYKLRQLNTISNQGSNLTQIMQIGDLLGMSSRALNVELS